MRLVISDAHTGLKTAIAAAIRTIFAQPDASHVHERLDGLAGMLGRQLPKVETMLRDAADDLLAFTPSPPGDGRRGSGPPTAWKG